MLRMDQRHRGLGLVALFGGLVLVAVAAVVVSKANPALSSLDAVVVSIGLLAVLIGALLVLLGVAYWLAGRDSTWPIATARAVLVAGAVVLTFVVVPAMWMYAMRLLGPEWAKDLVSLLYLAVALVATVTILRTPKKRTGPSGVSAYGRTLVRR
jgi:drug/metabolite transporter (DMT)-like permease